MPMSEIVEGQNELSIKFCGSYSHDPAILSIVLIGMGQSFFEHNRTPRCS